jgi:hypothetical protein
VLDPVALGREGNGENKVGPGDEVRCSTSEREIGKREGVRRVCPVQEVGQGLRIDNASLNEQVSLLHVLGCRKDLIDAQLADPNIGPFVIRLRQKQNRLVVGAITKFGPEFNDIGGNGIA